MAQKRNSDLVDLGEVLRRDAIARLEKGQTLGFKQEDGSIERYKIIRITKKGHHVWAEKTTLYTQEEMKKIWDDIRHV